MPHVDSFTLARILPKAVKWAEDQEAGILRNGAQLSAQEQALARHVGVTNPTRVRILTVAQIPMPTDKDVREVACVSGLLHPGVIGLHFGYGIYIRRGHEQSARVLSHEFRHVHQFEREGGSIAVVLPRHLRDVQKFGPRNAPHEVDARAHERASFVGVEGV